jgi:hypothetical protein
MIFLQFKTVVDMVNMVKNSTAIKSTTVALELENSELERKLISFQNNLKLVDLVEIKSFDFNQVNRFQIVVKCKFGRQDVAVKELNHVTDKSKNDLFHAAKVLHIPTIMVMYMMVIGGIILDTAMEYISVRMVM